MYKQNLYLYYTELAELELFDKTELLEKEMFFTIKLYLHLNCVLMLNWSVWNRTIFIKMDLAFDNLQRLIYLELKQPTKKRIYIVWFGFLYNGI